MGNKCQNDALKRHAPRKKVDDVRNALRCRHIAVDFSQQIHALMSYFALYLISQEVHVYNAGIDLMYRELELWTSKVYANHLFSYIHWQCIFNNVSRCY